MYRSRSTRDLDRLVHAATLLAKQQYERLALGGPDEADDVAEENRRIADECLPIIEQALDEDLVTELEGQGPVYPPFWPVPPIPPIPPGPWSTVRPPWPPFPPWPSAWGGSAYRTSRAVAAVRRGPASSYTDELLDRAIEDFHRMLARDIRQAHRDHRGVSEAELKESLDQLRHDLEFVINRSRRSQRRAEQTADEELGTTGAGRRGSRERGQRGPAHTEDAS